MYFFRLNYSTCVPLKEAMPLIESPLFLFAFLRYRERERKSP